MEEFEVFPLDPRLDDLKEQSDVWEDIGAMNNVDLAVIFEGLRQLTPEPIFLSKGSEILEIGVGKAELFQRLRDEGYKITGLDGRQRPEHNGLPIIHGRIEEMPFNRTTTQFDVVMGSSFFDDSVYAQNPPRMLQRIHEATRLGGVFIYACTAPIDMPTETGFKEVHIAHQPANLQIFKKWREAV